MSDKIRDYTGALPPPDPKKDADMVDTEKFKKILKVDESEESQKREKRRLKKQEEDQLMTI